MSALRQENPADPLVIHTPQGHFSFHTDPDGYPLYPPNKNGLTTPQIPNALKASNPRQTLVAILDTGLTEPMARYLRGRGATVLGQQKFDGGTGTPVQNPVPFSDTFNITQIWDKSHGTKSNPPLQGPGHGTPIAYLINQLAPDAHILPVEVCKDERCEEAAIIQGVCHVLEVARSYDYNVVFNMSFSSYTPTDVLGTFMRYASGLGAVFVASASNEIDHRNPTGQAPVDVAFRQGGVTFPAGYGINLPVMPGDVTNPPGVALANASIPGVIGVANMELRGNSWQLANTSVWGAHVSFAAPGRQLVVRTSEDGYYSGTSFAAALTTGRLAFLRSFPGNTKNNPTDLIECLKDQTTQVGYSPAKTGSGFLDMTVPYSKPLTSINCP